mgnify:FL=1
MRHPSLPARLLALFLALFLSLQHAYAQSILRDAESGADTAIWLVAKRPSQPEEELVWFDRAVRTAHVYPHTRTTRETPQSLVAWLEAELGRGPR